MAVSLLLGLLPGANVLAEDAVIDPATGKRFPRHIAFTEQDTRHKLSLTGVAVRKRFFWNIYSIAHYMQAPPTGADQAVLREVMRDGAAKQVTMDFARDLEASQVRDSLLEAFRENTTESEYRGIGPDVQRFTAAIYQDVKKNDRFVMRWLPGGTTVSLFQNREIMRITNRTFAKVLWSIWFGERAVVDRSSLIEHAMVGS